jgi:hypothetical protein
MPNIFIAGSYGKKPRRRSVRSVRSASRKTTKERTYERTYAKIICAEEDGQVVVR